MHVKIESAPRLAYDLNWLQQISLTSLLLSRDWWKYRNKINNSVTEIVHNILQAYEITR